MKDQHYGHVEQNRADDALARHAEEISLRGFTIVPDLLSAADLTVWRNKIDTIYELQEREYGRDSLSVIQELDVCRAPLLYDFEFIKLATHPFVLALVRRFLGDWFILNLQNAIINRPGIAHHQTSWHRDLPYQNWMTSRPTAISALVAIDEFSGATGGTHVVPFTHKTDVLPSDSYIESNRVVAASSAGSAIVFDSMLFHRAGLNTSPIVRRAVNHFYTTPGVKQQYDFPRALGENRKMEPEIERLLGYTSQVPLNDREWRSARAAKFSASKSDS